MNLFQSSEWEEFKLKTGWQKSYRVDGILILQKDLPLGQKMLYSPMVELNKELRIMNNGFMDQIKQIAKDNNAIFYRLEIDAPVDDQIIKKLKSLGFRKAAAEIQPEQTRIIDLNQSEEEILAQMKPKGRYNIKVAEKHEVKVEETNDIKRFYKLYSSMSHRHEIGSRPLDYFTKLFDILHPKRYLKVFVASAKNYDLAAAVVAYYDQTATYAFGGSTDTMKNLMAPYLLHWHIIREAKNNGFASYDLFGVSPEGAKDHRWSGVTAFKEKLGGQYVELIGSWDYPISKSKYILSRFFEKKIRT